MDVRKLPAILTKSRLLLGPLVLLEVLLHMPGRLIGVTLIVGLLTDIFDGVIARRLKIVTAELRVDDSRADGVYTFCVIAAICVSHPGVVSRNWTGLALIAALEAVTTIVDFARYGRPCSHHAYTAKLWAAAFCVTAVAILAFDRVQPYLNICIACGVVNNLEGYVIRGLLPQWAHDVSGIPAAIRLRRVQIMTAAKPGEH